MNRIASIAHHPASTLVALAAFASLPLSCIAQSWKPERPVEIIVGCAPGCGPDNAARLMQSIFQAKRYVEVPITIQNKAGGGGSVAHTYLRQFERNGHYLYHTDRGLMTAHALGRIDNRNVTPVAILFGEYIGVAVKADSPIKSGRDLVERLKKDPAAHSIGIATAVGNTNHQGVASALKEAGIDVRKTRNVAFSSGAQAITAMLGGHIEVVPVSVGLWVDHARTGAVRVIAVTSAERLKGALADVPTWREQGSNVVLSNWRAMVGTAGLTPPQVEYWESIFERLVNTDEWKADMARRHAFNSFQGSAAMKKQIDDEYPDVKALLIAMELAKK
jgi:putative tricarboxylic transport membrane protein